MLNREHYIINYLTAQTIKLSLHVAFDCTAALKKTLKWNSQNVIVTTKANTNEEMT